MKSRARIALAAWLAGVALAATIAARAHYTADLSAFLPAAPSAAQQLVVEQLREGPASRLILAGIEGGDAALRARLSGALAARLRADARFRTVANGDTGTSAADRAFVFGHRYLLSPRVVPGAFTAAGLAGSIGEGVDRLASTTGLLAQDLFARDPTGETLAVLESLDRPTRPASAGGVWSSRDGSRAILVATTRAGGADTDGQAEAIGAIRAAFGAEVSAAGPAAAAATLRLTGPGVFAVEARALIEHEAVRLSTLSALLIAALLLAVYRSPRALALGMLPVATGALAGVAAVAAGFGVVHGVTLGFGVTLIGESVDYSVYLFIQGQGAAGVGRDDGRWIADFWPTVRLGLLTSLCGFLSLLPSTFPGLAQLGLYSVVGLAVAGLVTRHVMPPLMPARLRLADVSPLGRGFLALTGVLRRGRGGLWLVPLAAAAVLGAHHDRLWNRELQALSPVPPAAQAYDSSLRADLGAPDVRTLIVVSAADAGQALDGAAAVVAALEPLVRRGQIASADSAARYLPGPAVQAARRAALPAPEALRSALHTALADLPVEPAALAGFVADVASARGAPLLTRRDLDGTQLAAVVDALLVQHGARWNALVPLEAPRAGAGAAAIDLGPVTQALAGLSLPAASATVLDLKRESDALYAGYLAEALRLSLAGLAALLLLLAVALRSAARVLRVVAPLVLAVLTVMAGFALAGQGLTILHLVGLLLIFAIGSNYALFFDREAAADAAASARTVASLLVANLTTVIGFGVLALSHVPVLAAVGATVAPGALLALLYAALLARPAPAT
ncbi:MAG: MMPL family transporter [Proteobacteria bacterium]|nr:MMPL family transporter [Pseudomonadota bacterium]